MKKMSKVTQFLTKHGQTIQPRKMLFEAKHAPFIWTPEAKKHIQKFKHSPLLQ
jgi:hypothetical protein